ncbi:thioredoxin-like protein [Jaminaea rosea]|uniref:Thioredoxin-like protein n=1 Tax=Jaminaea rosea TaxID=1569628 RepID=A0A316UXS8_9BASI|nr:thioredoxin-like protein [Jaminaea rosea]PWN27945.1 thioredoxin-like protein [Jaminaea rosea]
MGEYRERRMQQLKEELASRPAPTSGSDGQPRLPDLGVDSSQVGKYIFLDSEKEAIKLLEKSGRKVVLHFSHKEFQRCKIMDQHLETLAALHPSTLFLAVSPTKAPFLVHKMQVKVLPYVVCFVDGQVKDRIVGFEELGNTDSFKLHELEERLGTAGVIIPRSKQNANKPVYGFAPQGTTGDGDDWD